MDDLFTFGNLFTLLMLIALQAVLGFDNLLYVSIESKRVAEDKQQWVRRVGIVLAVLMRIVLLVVLLRAIEYFKTPLFIFTFTGVIEAAFTVHSMIVLAGGAFIVYTAVKEIFHMIAIDDMEGHATGGKRSVGAAVFRIVLMNLIFSFDSILSAIALTENVWVMSTAIIIGGLLMILLADGVAGFLKKNRMYEVLGLFILFIVGIMLLSEGGHLAHLSLLSHPVEAMTKSTFYFVIAVLVVVDVVQGRYQKKLLSQQEMSGEKR